MARVETYYDDQYNKVNFVNEDDDRTGFVSGLDHPDDRKNVTRFIIDGEGYRVGKTVWIDGELAEEIWYPQNPNRGRGPIKVVEGIGMKETWLD